jgi:oligosaccharide repeat unit polymerase
VTAYALAYFSIAAVSVAASVRAGWGLVNPLTVLFGVWVPLVVLVESGVLGVAPLEERTWFLVLLASVAIVAGCVYGVNVLRHPRVQRERQTLVMHRLDATYPYLVIALAGYVGAEIVTLLPVLEASGGLQAVFGGSSGEGIGFRRALQNDAYAAAATPFSGGSALLGVIKYALFFGSLSLFLGARYVRNGQIMRGLLPLLLMGGYSLLALQRFSFVYSLLLFAFAYVYFGEPRSLGWRLISRRVRWAVALLCVLLVVIVYVPLKAREPTTTPATAADSAMLYYVGGLAALNVRVSGNASAGSFERGYGTWSFWGAASIVKRAGVPLDLPPTTLPFVNVRTDGVQFSNVYTFLAYFMNDFGDTGVFILPLILGAVAGGLHASVVFRQQLALIPAASIVMTTLFMSFFGFSLVRDFRYTLLAIVSVPVLTWMQRNQAPGDEAGAADPRPDWPRSRPAQGSVGGQSTTAGQ